jgi:hypothetical protein
MAECNLCCTLYSRMMRWDSRELLPLLGPLTITQMIEEYRKRQNNNFQRKTEVCVQSKTCASVTSSTKILLPWDWTRAFPVTSWQLTAWLASKEDELLCSLPAFLRLKHKVNMKSSTIRHHVTKTCVNESLATRILNRGCRWRRVVKFKTRPLCPVEKVSGTYWVGGWLGLIAGIDEVGKIKISAPIGKRIPNSWLCRDRSVLSRE